LLNPFVAPLRISSLPAKQRGKKHGKGMVNLGDGFVSVDYESGWDSVIIKDFPPPEPLDFGNRAFRENRRRKLGGLRTTS
jgi:hypothetical protein